MLEGKYIAIEGNIGAGKTSLARLLAKRFNGSLLLEEFAENTFLPQFYKDPERFAFPLEMSFMAERYGQMKKKFDSHVEKNLIISDFIFDKSLLFARVNLKEDELKLFENFYNLVKDFMPKPDLLIFIKREETQLKINIEKRGRSFEKEIGSDYLKKLNESYDQFLTSNVSLRKLVFSSKDLDFVTNKMDFELIVDKILNS